MPSRESKRMRSELTKYVQFTAGGRRRTRAHRGNLKRTTRKGAYALNRKKAIGTRLRPMVETKKWKDSDLGLIVTNVSPGEPYGEWPDPRIPRPLTMSMSNISPMCCNFGFNGIDGSMFLGDNRYHRMMQQKIKITFPQGENIPLVPQEAWLIHGWVLEPLNVSTITSGAVQPTMVTPAFLTTYITEQVKEYFNQREDVLDWVPKGRSSIKVLGKRLIRPRSNTRAWSTAANSLGATTTGYPADGQVIPDAPLYKITWRMNRKAQMYEGPVHSGDTSTGPSPLHFERGNWLPFSVIFQPEFDQQYPSEGPSRLYVSWDTQLYYTDM